MTLRLSVSSTGATTDSDDPFDPDGLRRNVDAQIRALTKGDITKEPTVLAMDAFRAITELDALAREYDELNKKYPGNCALTILTGIARHVSRD